MIVYGFVYPMLVLCLVAPLSAVVLGMSKREKREAGKNLLNLFCGIVTFLY